MTSKERPIIFSGAMVRAIMDGRKTQTRRVIRHANCPYGSVGDVLYVREKWQALNQNGQWWHEVPRHERDQHFWEFTNPVAPAISAMPPRWLPSIHMPRDAYRISLGILSIRRERLQSISEADARAEGVRASDFEAASSIEAFRLLWDEINGVRGFDWESNPLVWVVCFRMLEE